MASDAHALSPIAIGTSPIAPGMVAGIYAKPLPDRQRPCQFAFVSHSGVGDFPRTKAVPIAGRSKCRAKDELIQGACQGGGPAVGATTTKIHTYLQIFFDIIRYYLDFTGIKPCKAQGQKIFYTTPPRGVLLNM